MSFYRWTITQNLMKFRTFISSVSSITFLYWFGANLPSSKKSPVFGSTLINLFIGMVFEVPHCLDPKRAAILHSIDFRFFGVFHTKPSFKESKKPDKLPFLEKKSLFKLKRFWQLKLSFTHLKINWVHGRR